MSRPKLPAPNAQSRFADATTSCRRLTVGTVGGKTVTALGDAHDVDTYRATILDIVSRHGPAVDPAATSRDVCTATNGSVVSVQLSR